MRSQINQLFVLLALLFLSACMLDGTSLDGTRPPILTPILCTTDVDCSSHERNCQHGICVDGPKDAQLLLSLVIVPPPERSDVSPISVRSETIDFATQHTVVLPPTVSVQGLISQKGHSSSTRAQLFFSRQDDLPGRRYTQSITTEDDGSFALQLPAGDYMVSIRDDQDDFLERVVPLRVSRANESAMTYLELPTTKDFIRWTGRLVRFDDQLETRPIEGVTVWATDTSSSTQSSLATTKEDGVFSFYLHRDVEEFRLHLRGRTVLDGGDSFLIPATSFSALSTYGIESDVKDAEIPGYELMLGVLQPSVRVRGVVHSPLDEPVAGARVLAQVRMPAMEGDENIAMRDRASLEARAVTDDKGAFELFFPPMDDVRLTAFSPATAAKVSDDTVLRRIGLTGGGIDAPHLLKLQRPVPVVVTVYDANGEPVREYQARFELEDSEYLSPRNFDASVEEFSLTTSAYAHTDDSFHLSQGLWRMTVTPRQDLTLPLNWVTELIRSPKGDLTVQLPPGIAAGFVVLDEQGEPVRGATVELWLESPQDGARPTLLGSTQSNVAGEATVLVPWLHHEFSDSP